MPPTPLSVFVYGTLKPGGFYYQQYCEGRVVASYPAIALGQLYDLPLGYPAMTVGNDAALGYVKGYVLMFNDAAMLDDLDELEGYDPQRSPDQNEYERVWLEVFDGDAKQFSGQSNHTSLGAWTYVMTLEQVQGLGGIVITQGVWTDRKR